MHTFFSDIQMSVVIFSSYQYGKTEIHVLQPSVQFSLEDGVPCFRRQKTSQTWQMVFNTPPPLVSSNLEQYLIGSNPGGKNKGKCVPKC